MKLLSLVSLLPFFTSVVWGCGDDHGHDHVHEKRAAPLPLTPPSRPLEWGDINVLHTTDTHGWLLGHQKASLPEPNYSGTLGDFASFVSHMQRIAIQKDVDLLLVDSGDIHDGTGLTDGFPAGGVDAHDANKFFVQLPYDIMAIGNHELYIYANTLDMVTNFVPKLNGRYLSSNVNITVSDKKGNAVSVPVGNRFTKFKTRKGRKVTSFGVLFDFTGNAQNTTVQKVADMVKEKWFTDAIKEEPDLFLLVGHMPVQKDNWPLVFNTIRAVHPTTPIMIFGGHTHIRDCVQLDSRSMALESGRYMETVGWMSAKLDKKGSKTPIKFSRRYLDPNRLTYQYHTITSSFNFDTFQGISISSGLNKLAEKFDLNFKFGTAPRDFSLFRDPYPSEGSEFSLFAGQAMPTALKLNNTRADVPAVMIINSGSQRFDIFSGTFTKNDQLTVSPFVDEFLFIADVPARIAKKVLPALNGEGAQEKREEMEKREREAYALGEVDTIYNRWLQEMDKRELSMERRAAKNLTTGYVTTDACPGVGDDTLHAPMPFFNPPDFIASDFPDVNDDTPVDLVFVDFIATQLVQLINTIQTEKTYTSADVQKYSSVRSHEVLGVFAQQAWN